MMLSIYLCFIVTNFFFFFSSWQCALGLLQLKMIPSALDLYQRQLEEELKLIVRTVVGDYLSSSDEDGILLDVYDPQPENEKDGVITQSMKRLRTLEHSGFLSCLEMCFHHLETALRHATAMSHFLSHSLLESEKKNSEVERPSSISPSPSAAAPGAVRHINNCIKNAGDLVERTVSQLMDLRRGVHSCLSAEQLRQVGWWWFIIRRLGLLLLFLQGLGLGLAAAEAVAVAD